MYNVVFVYWNRTNRYLEMITEKSVLEQKNKLSWLRANFSRKFIEVCPPEFKSVKETQLQKI